MIGRVYLVFYLLIVSITTILYSSCTELIAEDQLNNNFDILRQDSYGVLKVSELVVIAKTISEKLPSLPTKTNYTFKLPIADCNSDLEITVQNAINLDLISLPYTITLNYSQNCLLYRGSAKIVYYGKKRYMIKTNSDFRLFSKRGLIEADIYDLDYNFLYKNFTYTGTYVYYQEFSILNTLSHQGEFRVYVYPNIAEFDPLDDFIEVSFWGVGRNVRKETISLKVSDVARISKMYTQTYFTKGILTENISQRTYQNTIDYGGSSDIDKAKFTVDIHSRIKAIRPDKE